MIKFITIVSVITIIRTHYFPNISWDFIVLISGIYLLSLMMTRKSVLNFFEQLAFDKLAMYHLILGELAFYKPTVFIPEKNKRNEKALTFLRMKLLCNSLLHHQPKGESKFSPVTPEFNCPRKAFDFMITEGGIQSVVKFDELTEEDKQGLIELANQWFSDLYLD